MSETQTQITEEQLVAVFMAGFSSGYDSAVSSLGAPDIVGRALAHRRWHEVMDDPLHRLEVASAASSALEHPERCPAQMNVVQYDPTEGGND